MSDHSEAKAMSLQEAMDQLVAVAACHPALPQMLMLQRLYSFLINDVGYMTPRRFSTGKLIDQNFYDLQRVANHLRLELEPMLDAYERAYGIKLSEVKRKS